MNWVGHLKTLNPSNPAHLFAPSSSYMPNPDQLLFHLSALDYLGLGPYLTDPLAASVPKQISCIQGL